MNKPNEQEQMMARQILNLSVGVHKNRNKFNMNLIELIMNKFTLIALLASACLGDKVQAATKPNIVFILADDMNRDTWGAYGGPSGTEANRGKPIQGDTEPKAAVDHSLTPYKDSFTKYQ